MVSYTNKRIKKAIKRFVKKVKVNYLLKKAILFGSRARGDYFLDSDADILLISKDFEGKRINERIADLLELWEESIDLEILPYTPDEFKKKKNQIGIVQQAVNEGIEIK